MTNSEIDGTNGVLGAATTYVESSYADDLANWRVDLARVYTPVSDGPDDACVVVVNQTSGPITLVDSHDVHGYWYSAPVVPDGSGSHTDSPFSVDGVGASDKVWIDAPPFDGYCTVGSWNCALHNFGLQSQAVLSLKIPGTQDNLWISAGIGSHDDGTGIGIDMAYAVGFQPSSAKLPDDGKSDLFASHANSFGSRAWGVGPGPLRFHGGAPKWLSDQSSDQSVYVAAYWYGPGVIDQNKTPTRGVAPLYVVVKAL